MTSEEFAGVVQGLVPNPECSAAGDPPRRLTRSEYNGPTDDCAEQAPIHSLFAELSGSWPTPERAPSAAEADDVGVTTAAPGEPATPPAEQPRQREEADASTDLAATSRASGSEVECLAPAELVEQARRE